jgi:hypothetical protein
MTEYTVEDYKRGARAAHAAGDIAAAQRLIAAARALEETQSSQAQEGAPDTSLSGAFGYGVDNAQRILGMGIEGVGQLSGIQSVEQYGADVARHNQDQIDQSNYQRPEGADGIMSNLREGDLANAGRSLVYGAAEAAPQVGAGAVASIGAGLAATSAPVIGTGLAVGGTIAGTTMALGSMRDERQQQGLDTETTATDLAAAIASGLIELTPVRGGGAIMRVVREGLQEAGQEGLIIGGTAVQGGEYVPEDIINRLGDAAAIGATVSGTINAGVTTVNRAGDVVLRNRDEVDPETSQAAGDVARMFSEIADNEGYNIRDIDPSSQRGANAVLNAARGQLQTEINANARVLRKEVLNGADENTLARFETILRQARNKVATVVPQTDIDWVRDNYANTREGQALLQALRKSNVVTEVYSRGLKGGISQFTDVFNPLPRFGRVYNPTFMTGNLNAGAALVSGGSTLAAQIPLVVGGRAIDAVTGRRSKLNTFIKQNRKKQGLESPTGPSVEGRTARLRAQAKAAEDARKAREAADAAARKKALEDEEAATNVRMWRNGEYPVGRPDRPSPRLAMFQAIAEVDPTFVRDRSPAEVDAEVARILAAAARNTTDTKRQRNIRAYQTILETGRAKMNGKPLNEVISIVKTEIAKAARSKAKQVTQAPQGQADIPVSPRSAKIEEGVRGNRAFLKALRDDMNADKTVSSGDRAILTKAMDELGLNLGLDVVAKAKSILDEATASLSSPALAAKYLKPYIDRINTQQAAAKAKASKATAKAKAQTNVPQQAPSNAGPNTGPVSATPAPQAGVGPAGGTTQAPSGPDSGGGGVLAAPSPASKPVQTAPAPKQATPAQVKANLPEARALVEIGKKGTKYENGIQDVDTALEVAKLLGITAQMLSSGSALHKMTKSPKGTFAVHSWSPTMRGFGSKVFFIKPKGSYGGEKVTSIRSLAAALHEMGHSLTQGNMDGKGEFGITTVKNKLNNSTDQVGANSYNSSVMKPILETLGADHPAIKEIIAFQEAGQAYIESNPSDTTPVREFGYYFKKLQQAEKDGDTSFADAIKRSLKQYRDYTNLTPELSVDPMWLYLMNPRLAKELMPINSAMIKAEFDKANNGKILFFSHPFATILAVAMAMGLVAAGGEEEEPMPNGILSA